MTATRITAAAVGGGGALPGGVFNVADYGAVGDGTTDDRAAIQAAIAAAQPVGDRGGTVIFPWGTSGTYKVTSALSANNTSGLKLVGVGGRKQFQSSPTIAYSGAAGNAITAYHSQGFTMEGLRVRATNAAFTGDLLDLGATGGDTQQFQLHNCAFVVVGTGASLVRLNYSIIGTIKECHFGGASIGIKVGDGNYCVGVQIRDNTFNCGTTGGEYAVVTNGGAEAILIEGNTFEAQAGTYAGAWRHIGGVAWHVSFRDNWMGDQSSGTYPWIKVEEALSTFEIANNRFTAPGNALTVAGGGAGILRGGLITGNFLDSPNTIDLGANSHQGLYIFGNYPVPTVIGTGGSPHAAYAETVNGKGYDLGAGFPTFGHGTGTPRYGIDILPGSDHRALRLLDGGINFGGSEGNADSTRQITPNINGFYFAAGDAAGANLGLVLAETSVGSVGANSAVLYIEDNGAGKTRLRIKWDNGSDTILATEP